MWTLLPVQGELSADGGLNIINGPFRHGQQNVQLFFCHALKCISMQGRQTSEFVSNSWTCGLSHHKTYLEAALDHFLEFSRFSWISLHLSAYVHQHRRSLSVLFLLAWVRLQGRRWTCVCITLGNSKTAWFNNPNALTFVYSLKLRGMLLFTLYSGLDSA